MLRGMISRSTLRGSFYPYSCHVKMFQDAKGVFTDYVHPLRGLLKSGIWGTTITRRLNTRASDIFKNNSTLFHRLRDPARRRSLLKLG